MAEKLTLAQFKRDATTGHMGLELIERYGEKIKKSVVVPVVKVQTNGVYLKRGDKESFLDYPFASLFEYTYLIFLPITIFNYFIREVFLSIKFYCKHWELFVS